MAGRITRRRFLATTAASSVLIGVHSFPTPARPAGPNDKLRIAAIGVANKGGHNIEQLRSEEFVALCDVDSNYLDRACQEFPAARRYRDYRQMLEAEQARIDAVVVSTADHNHAPATSRALKLGKPVYCEKPLTHTVEEARKIAELAQRQKVATQMGTQIHAENNYRRVVELVRGGAVGDIHEVYTWCNKGWSAGHFEVWNKPVPANLDWNLWLGPAHERPYSPNIHPANWRRFWEYGSGTLGDMACHIMDLPFWALELTYPLTVQAQGTPVDPVGTPDWCQIAYEFQNAQGGKVKLYWSDGTAHHELVAKTRDNSGQPLSDWGLGVLFVGSRGMLAADYGRRILLPEDTFHDYKPPAPSIPDSIGHWNEWVQACKTGSPTTCNFTYSGRLTESVLLGTVAYRTGKTLDWDHERLKARGCPEADAFLRKSYRTGWELVS